ncbi:hypothetical protein RFEPED_0332 [Rickettsia felis str. Pedreira]|uniref:Uncharacterized protein n=1 Tax=Rickettsia felis str. Pedreira TaxID=1359196 RepID=A0A0F3MQL4_RICFI|nr:hypothetical protein [Rickettsia felis]KJV57961.1 hypothetical protein RFEPED_0332 [Rickettsia felis str. Pedreira]
MREELRSNQGEAISGYLTRLPRRLRLLAMTIFASIKPLTGIK